MRYLPWLLLLLLSGCATKIGSLSAYKPVSLEPADIMPSKTQLKEGTTKVILFKVDDSRFSAARNAGLGQSIAVDLTKKLSRGGGVEVIDRTAATSLENEIRLAELSGTGDNVELSVASFALKPEISGASFGSHYTAPVEWTDKEGKKHVTPGFYTYTGNVSGLVKIFGIPSMKVLRVVSFAGQATSRETIGRGSRRKTFDASLMISAATRALTNARPELLTFLAPKGYVLSKRMKDDETIVQISLGSAKGVKQDDSVVIYTMYSEVNPLTGEPETQEIPIAEGVVTEHVTGNRAWVLIDEEDPSHRIRLGDYTKKQYEISFMESLEQMDLPAAY